MTEDQIKELIESSLDDCQVTIQGDGRHFEALVISPAFEGKPLLARHRLVYAALGERFQKDEIHALSFKTYTAAEWLERSAST